MVSERSLARICRPAVLGRGRLIASHGDQIHERTCRYDASLTRLSACVTSSLGEGRYRVNVSLDEAADTLVEHRCTCMAAAKFPGPCKHAIAVTLDFNGHPDAYSGWDELEHVATTPAVADYLRRLSAEPLGGALDGKATPEGEVYLEPSLAHASGLFLRLRIGNQRGSYAVKDIGELVARVSTDAWFSYGKQLAFVHCPSAFEPWSRELLDFLGRCMQNRHAYALEHRLGYRYGSGALANAARELRLSDPEVDELIARCRGRELRYEYYDGEGNRVRTAAHVVDGTPDVRMTIRAVGDGSFELQRQGDIDFFATASRAYAFQAGTLYCCPAAYASASDFFSEVYCSPSPGLLLSADDAPRFAALSLPTIEMAMPVDVDPEMSGMRPEGCRIEFRLDRSDGMVTCDVLALYGSRRHHLLEREVGDGIDYTRDMRREAAARALVGRYFSGSTRGRASISERNGDALAALLFDGLPEMRKMGTVVASSSFGRLTSHAHPRISIGLSVRSNLLDLSVSSEDLPLDELHALLRRYRLRKRYYRMSDGSFIDLTNLNLDRESLLVDELGLSPDDLATGHASLPSYKAFLLDALLSDDERDDAFDRYVEGFRTVDPLTYEPPESLRPRLRPYQVDGYRWLAALTDMGFGGILADEMGLGKSVQLIALLLEHHEQLRDACPLLADDDDTNERPSRMRASGNDSSETDAATPSGVSQSLIVCPASLVYNWQAEFAKFAPEMDVAVVAGTVEERRRIRDEGHEVLVTSYDLLRRDVEDYVGHGFWCLALDEAHYIKNHRTLIAQAVKTINAEHRFALTGTPVENRLAELWSIFDFLMPGLLGGYERFRERYEQPIVDGDEIVAERLRAAVGPFIMRRLKADVLDDLPDKLEQTVIAPMGPVQRRLYLAHEQLVRHTLVERGDAAFRRERMQILAELMRLRQLCCDPRLVYEDYDGESCKLDTLVELVESAISSQQKVLVFSQFTSFLSLIARALEEREIAFHTITGATPKRQRVQLVDAFNDDETPVFLVSLKAGGTGLNLIGASVVIHADPWWNAAAQDQATDRAHRIGQTRNVTVYKVIAKDTIEERIIMLQAAKSDLAEQIVGTGGASGLSSITRADLIALLGDEEG